MEPFALQLHNWLYSLPSNFCNSQIFRRLLFLFSGDCLWNAHQSSKFWCKHIKCAFHLRVLLISQIQHFIFYDCSHLQFFQLCISYLKFLVAIAKSFWHAITANRSASHRLNLLSNWYFEYLTGISFFFNQKSPIYTTDMA